MKKAKAPVSQLVLADGRTETLLDLPKGDYEIEVSFLSPDGRQLLKAPTLQVPVVKQGF